MAALGGRSRRWIVLAAMVTALVLAVVANGSPALRGPDGDPDREVDMARRRGNVADPGGATTGGTRPTTIATTVTTAPPSTTTTTAPGDPGTDPGSTGSSGGGGGGGGGGGTPDDPGPFVWSLPDGDLSPDGYASAYNAVYASCAEGRAFVEQEVADPEAQDLWPHWRVHLFEAGIAVCFGDVESGRTLLADAGLTNHVGDCRIYKATVSVVDQVPQSGITCPAPIAPIGTGDPNTTTTADPFGGG